MNVKTVVVFLTAMALATVAAAQTKLSGTAQCGKPDPQHGVEVGDRPGHSFMVSQSKCTWTKPFEIEGVQGKDTVLTAFDEVSGNGSNMRGFFLTTMANGDKNQGRFQGTAALKDGAPQSVEGTWTFAGGTGKLKGIKGKGTSKGKGNPDGSITYEIEGEYTLPK